MLLTAADFGFTKKAEALPDAECEWWGCPEGGGDVFAFNQGSDVHGGVAMFVAHEECLAAAITAGEAVPGNKMTMSEVEQAESFY